MKINEKILSIPPYISTTWGNIATIKMKATLISITLTDGDTIHVPGLEKETIDLIFKTHLEQIEKSCLNEFSIPQTKNEMEKKELSILSQTLFGDQQSAHFPLKFGFATLDGLNTVVEHNPLEMDAPNLPEVLLEKIGSIAKVIAPDDLKLMPREVPNCNCFHCQITKKINESLDPELLPQLVTEVEGIAFEEEIVQDHELTFNQWTVIAKQDNLFNVVNKLDPNEEYQVFLGSPVGCNCGHKNCDHILAVLRT